MKIKLLLGSATGLLLFCMVGLANASLLPIGDFGVENMQGSRSSGIYGWTYSYDISFLSQDLIIDIDINLVGADPSGYRDTWEYGIESIWGKAFDIYDGTYLYDTVFNVDWVETSSEADFEVTVIDGKGGSNMTTWYTDRPHGYYEELAAHEFGHMMGLYDEYTGGAIDPDSGLIRDNIMGCYYRNNNTFADQYDPFRSWLEGNTSLDLEMVIDSGDHYYASQSVPEPATILVFSLGLLGIGAFRKKFKKA